MAEKEVQGDNNPGWSSTNSADDYPSVPLVLMVLLAVIMFMGLAGGLLFTLVAGLLGWDTGLLGANFPSDADVFLRWRMRCMLSVSHLFTFVFPALGVLIFFYRSARGGIWGHLRALRLPTFSELGWSLLVFAGSVPFVLWTVQVNKAIPIPPSWRAMEASAEEAIRGLMVMGSPYELLGNLFVVAVLPAFGEELVFRGVLLRALLRRFAGRPAVAIIVSAFVFSFIHFQFEGFIPRMVLGGCWGGYISGPGIFGYRC